MHFRVDIYAKLLYDSHCQEELIEEETAAHPPDGRQKQNNFKNKK